MRGLDHQHLAPSSAWPNAARAAAATAMAAALLGADSLAGLKGVPGTIYIPLLIAVASNARQGDIKWFGGLAAGFILVCFGFGRSFSATWVTGAPGLWLLGLGLGAVAATTFLLSRLVASREAVQRTNEAIVYNEWRYRSVFEQSYFPFVERDFSGALKIFRQLRADGVTDLVAYDRDNPGFARRIAESVVFLDFNSAMMTLLGAATRAEFPKTLAEVNPEPASMLAAHQALFDGATRLDGRSQVTTLQGQILDVWVTGDMDPDPNRPGVLVGFVVDMTESESARRMLAIAQGELERASQVAAIGTLSASIARELHRPLDSIATSARTCLQALRRPDADVASAVTAVEWAVKEGGRAAEVVRRTRDMVTSGGREETTDVETLVEDVLLLMDQDIRDACAEVSVSGLSDPMALAIDRLALQQVLINLISNGLQAMTAVSPETRKLIVTLQFDQGMAVIAVRDTGLGLAAEHLDRLFDPFFTTKDDGVGVGLSISREIIEARGGVLKGRNAEAGGAIFECRIPAHREEDEHG